MVRIRERVVDRAENKQWAGTKALPNARSESVYAK